MRNTKLFTTGFLSTVVTPVVGLILFFAPASAQAQPVTFAQAFESSASTNSNDFAYNNNATEAELGTSTGTTIGASVPINFAFQAGAGTLAPDLTGLQNATLTMTSSTVGANSVTTAFGGTYAQENINGGGAVTDTIKITRNAPAAEGSGTKTNLLTVTFTGVLAGIVGDTTPYLYADTELGNTVTYSSDFVTLSTAIQRDFNIAFSSWSPNGLGINPNGFFNSATAAGVSTFDFQGASLGAPPSAPLPNAAIGAVVIVVVFANKFRSQRSRKWDDVL